MLVKKIYLVRGIKHYPPFTGDTNEEHINVLIPSNSAQTASDTAVKNYMDEVTETKLLYEVTEGSIYEDRGVWEVIAGIDSKSIYTI
jgi:hypothetical protein